MTNTVRFTVVVLLASFAVAVLATSAWASDAQKSFDQIKSLAGAWEGKNSQGQPLTVTFRSTAGGSAIMSEINGKGENMITMFHLDGPDRLLMTHYCAAGNQPRMQANASPDGKTITFNFVDGTGIEGAHMGHMQQLVITMADANHHIEEWTFDQQGKQMKEVFELHRKD